ncbi:phosphatase PAP2 family protein [Mycobacterium sp. Z3061]|uniref:phosphatase PAP2 family protein n=1 Tax=Mycobacterium sp. Z3061 TaxID=3073562 RepID=UPI002873F1B8|nr:phosphatase PAP2 family protein [Mycobacterium sp. Z3061]
MSSPRIASRLSWSAGLVAAAVALYALLWVGHREHWGWLHAFDWALLNPAHEIGIKHAGWVRFWVVVSFVLGPIPLRLLGLAAMVYALVRRRVRMGLLLMACGPLNGFITLVAKNLAGRPRPVTALVHATETSFPSGHALEAMCSLLALLALCLPMLTRRQARVAAMVSAAFGVFIVGVARVALNVHHPSDVIAGWALGYVYFMLCLWAFRPESQPRDSTGS